MVGNGGKSSSADKVRQGAKGRWPEILPAFGADAQSLDGKHHPCPACGGDDRFRYDNRCGNGDYFCNQCGAGDGIGLVAKMKRLERNRAIEEIAKHLGIPLDDAKMVLPVPERAPVVSFRHRELGNAAAHWIYKDSSFRLLGYVCRFDFPTPKAKEIRTRTLWQDDGRLFWRWKNFIAPKPLYGLDRLAARPDADVLVAEGEKTCDAAANLMPDYVSISAYQGAQSPQTNDWSATKGRRLIIWADNDSAGMSYAGTVARCALAAGALSVKAIDLSIISAARRQEAVC